MRRRGPRKESSASSRISPISTVFARLAFHALLAFTLVLGIVQTGARVFYCAGMARLANHPCCDHSRNDDDDGRSDTTSVQEDIECCEARSIAPLPQVAGTDPVRVLDAPLAFVLPAVSWEIDRQPALTVADHTAIRDGPHVQSRERYAELMVFLI